MTECSPQPLIVEDVGIVVEPDKRGECKTIPLVKGELHRPAEGIEQESSIDDERWQNEEVRYEALALRGWALGLRELAE